MWKIWRETIRAEQQSYDLEKMVTKLSDTALAGVIVAQSLFNSNMSMNGRGPRPGVNARNDNPMQGVT